MSPLTRDLPPLVVKRWCNQPYDSADWPIPNMCNPCTCFWSEQGGIPASGGISFYYDPNNDFCGLPGWGIGGQNPGSMAAPGSGVTGGFLISVEGYDWWPAPTYGWSGTPPPLTAPPLMPPAVHVTMNGSTVFTFDPSAGSLAFTYAGAATGGCTTNPAPLAAAGIDVYKRQWHGTVTISQSCIQLATTDNPYFNDPYLGYVHDQYLHSNPSTYRSILLYTGPMPSTADNVVIDANWSALTASADSGIPQAECATNAPLGTNFMIHADSPGMRLPIFIPNRKFQWFPS